MGRSKVAMHPCCAGVVQEGTTGAQYNYCPPTELGGYYLPRQTWIQENNTPEEKDTQLCVLLSQTVVMADARPTVEPWREPVLHRFPRQVGANRTATSAGGKRQECRRYGHH